jgi:hypothetical protein
MTVYVYMRKRSNRQMLTSVEEVPGPYWSLWRRRRFPAGELAPGDRVLLVDHWREDDRLSWEVTPTHVEHLVVESKADAIAHISRTFAVDEDVVADDSYLSGKEDLRSVLLAWTAEPVCRLNLPRPPGLKIERHGWARLAEAETEQLLATAKQLAEAEAAALGLSGLHDESSDDEGPPRPDVVALEAFHDTVDAR